MPAQKRYFHCSQDLISDPEVWELMKEFGDRSILTWLQILIYLERTNNQWRMVGDWLAILSRSVRQSSTNLSRQVGWMVAKGWLEVGEVSATGSPLLLRGSNWLKYNKTRETKKHLSISDQEFKNKNDVSPPFLSFPFPSFPKEEIEEKIKNKTKSYGQVKPLPDAPKSKPVWDAYAEAYIKKYGVEPVRNRQVNALLCRVVDKLGAEEAPAVAAFYVSHNNPFYVSKRHPPNLLVQDAEGLRTQWATGVLATKSEARTAERKIDAMHQAQRLKSLIAPSSLLDITPGRKELIENEN